MAAQLFLRNTASDLGGAGQKSLSTTRGAASTTAITTTTVSGTNIQVTQTAGGQALTWFSDPVPAHSISGTVTVNIRGLESSTAVNAGAGILIERTNGAGVVQSTILSDRTVPATITEWGTTDSARTSTGLAVTATTFTAGDRVKVTLKVRNFGTMAAGTTTYSYDGPTAAAAGDTYVTFSDLLVTHIVPVAMTAQSNLTVAFPKTPPTYPITPEQLVEGIGTRVFSSVTTQAGDYIVVQGSAENNNTSSSNLTPTATGLTFVLQNDTGDATVSGNNRPRLFQWTALDSAGGNRVVTLTPQNAAMNYTARLTVVRGSEGPAGKGFTGTSQTVTVARQFQNSAIFYNVGDWSTGVVGTPVWTPGGSTVASQQGTAATYVYGRWDDSGLEANVAHGISSPTYNTPGIAVLEMRGKTPSSAAVVNGTAALTSDSGLTVAGTVTRQAAGTLTGQSNLSATGFVSMTGASALTGQSILSATGFITLTGASALSGQSTLVSAGIVTKLGSSTLTGQSTFTVTGIVSKLGTAALTSQSTFTVAGNVTKFGIANLTSDSTLTAAGTITGPGAITGDAALSGQSTLTVAGVLTRLAASGLSAQSALNVTAVVIKYGTSNLSSDSTFSVTGGVSKLGTAALTGQSNFVATAQVSTTGSANLSAQSTLVAAGTIGAVPITVTMTGASQLTVAGFVTAKGIASLTAQSNLVANAILTRFATVPLTGASTLVSLPIVRKFATATLSGQTTLSATGVIPGLITAAAIMSALSTMETDGRTSPPWTFVLIEFSSVEVRGADRLSDQVSNQTEATTSLSASIEGG